MKTIIHILAGLIFLLVSSTYAQVPAPAPEQNQMIVLKNVCLHDGNLNVIDNISIVMKEGKIDQIGPFEELQMDDKAQIIDLQGKHVYPGLVLPMSELGLVEIGAVNASNDTYEIGSLNPNVRSIVAYNTDSELIPVVRSNGVLVAQIIPSGGLLSGSSSVVQLDAWNWEDAILVNDNVLHLSWPAKVYSGWSGKTENKNYKAQIESLHKLFADAQAYMQSKNQKANLKLDALTGLFEGSKKLFISASTPEQIIESVSFAKKYQVKDIVLTGVDEDAWLVKDFIKENSVSVILNDPHGLPNKADNDVWINTKLPAMFYKEGIPVAISVSWLPNAMNYSFKAASAAPYGLSKEETLQIITKNAAKIIGVDDKLGTIEVGKDATLIVSDGDILDIASHNIIYAFINGRNINLDSRHKYLYEKYSKKYE